MGRAVRTAEIVLAGRDIPLTVLDDLAELDYGDLSGLFPAERLARFPEPAEARQRDKYRTVLPGGESYESAAPALPVPWSALPVTGQAPCSWSRTR